MNQELFSFNQGAKLPKEDNTTDILAFTLDQMQQMKTQNIWGLYHVYEVLFI